MDPSLYLDRDTFVHRLDPRTKMFLLLGMFALAFVFSNPLYLLGVLALVLFFGYLARSLANLGRIWFILVVIILVTSSCGPSLEGRDPVLPLRGAGGVLYGITIALRLVATVIAGMIFLSTTRNEEVAIGLVRLGIPYRFAFAVSTALRLVPTIVATGLTISQAQRSGASTSTPAALSAESANTCRSSCPSSLPRYAPPMCSRWRWSPRVLVPAPGARTISISLWTGGTCWCSWSSCCSWQGAYRYG